MRGELTETTQKREIWLQIKLLEIVFFSGARRAECAEVAVIRNRKVLTRRSGLLCC